MARVYVVAYRANVEPYEGISWGASEEAALSEAKKCRQAAAKAGVAKGDETLWVTVWDDSGIIRSYSV